MKIINLKAENIKRIEAVDITPTEHLVEITGKNGAGKTSVLDAIWWALAGAATHQPEPIRKGQRKARITLDMGDVIVTREFERKPPAAGKQDERLTTKIRVESADGARFPTPQKILDSLMGALSFDPLAFARQSPREQYDLLKTLLGLDFSEAEAASKIDYDKRTDYKRTANEKRAAAEAIAIAPDTPDALVDVKALLNDLQAAGDSNSEIDRIARARELMQAQIVRTNSEAEKLSVRAHELHDEADRVVAQAGRLAVEADKLIAALEKEPPLDDPVDTDPIREKIADSERVNTNVGAKRMRQLYEREAVDAQRNAEARTDQINERTAEIRTAIESAQMPVPGLNLVGGMVTLNDHPLEQASDAEQLRVSCAIAMRGDHKLRVIRVRDGSLLDEDSLEVLRTTAAEHDYQVWIELVDSTGKVGFVIEAGQVKSFPVRGTQDEIPDAQGK